MTTTRTVITPNGTTSTRELVRASSITGVGTTARDWGGEIGRPSRIFRIWANRLQNADIIDRGLIRQWCTGIVPRSHGYDFGGMRMNLTSDEAFTLTEMFGTEMFRNGRDGYRLTDEHEEFGREWLGNNWPALWRAFNPPDDLFSFEQVADTDTFRFVGWHEVGYGTWARPPSFVPYYTARYWAIDGELRTFTYYWSAWQSGGGR